MVSMGRGEEESSDGHSSTATMPSVFRQAIGAIKDQTSISLAKFSTNSSNLEVAILKATSHDEVPIDERHLADVLLLSASSPSSAATCLQILSRRISRTSNWVVALKSLVVVFRLLCNGGSQFIHEALAAGDSSPRLLDLSAFRDHSAASSPWDYSAFVRTFAVYLDARLESALLGKLSNLGRRPFMPADVFANMRSPLILGHIEHWQRLLDRAVGTRPTGPAKTNRLVQIALYLVVYGGREDVRVPERPKNLRIPAESIGKFPRERGPEFARDVSDHQAKECSQAEAEVDGSAIGYDGKWQRIDDKRRGNINVRPPRLADSSDLNDQQQQEQQ
ncbi:hypothetical protein B296_00019347 [Ensete ventricosum]|uniref:ENTH domain-containing protein n=1 Tax=Ensete ventricosum TaxID=4639 RepID=A0A426YKY3_ENSVE|nr:hypothetical protein B296_00019347 [Ensete ventricosum]